MAPAAAAVPAPAPPAYTAAGIPTPAVKIPYEVALERIMHTVLQTLKASGEQWDPGSRQDLVSTIFIQALRDGVVSWKSLCAGGAQ